MRVFPSRADRTTTWITAIVIDDDVDTVAVLAEFLRIKGITVVGIGYDGLEAVKIYEKLRPDVVFLDVRMGDHDGLYTLSKIRGIEPDAIVILITADVSAGTQKKLLDLGASAVIYKPYDINDVMEQTNRLVFRLKQEIIEDINAKKALLKAFNAILRNRLRKSEANLFRSMQYLNDKDKMV
ncbi:MAG: response regulator [Thaumarchaeota archaeon]|nr:response regulator [Nitrososphaerota archaeon]